MHKKAQMMGIGIFLSVFVGVIVALALYGPSVGFIGAATTTVTTVNHSITAPAAGVTVDLVGQELESVPVVINNSNFVVPASNYTIAETVSSVDGLKRISYTSHVGPYASKVVNITYVYGPEGYIDGAGSRSVAGLIAIFAALAIAVFTLSPVLKEKIFG